LSIALSVAGTNIGLGLAFIAFIVKIIRKKEFKFKKTAQRKASAFN
jgi:hypothetical protein